MFSKAIVEKYEPLFQEMEELARENNRLVEAIKNRSVSYKKPMDDEGFRKAVMALRNKVSDVEVGDKGAVSGAIKYFARTSGNPTFLYVTIPYELDGYNLRSVVAEYAAYSDTVKAEQLVRQADLDTRVGFAPVYKAAKARYNRAAAKQGDEGIVSYQLRLVREGLWKIKTALEETGRWLEKGRSSASSPGPAATKTTLGEANPELAEFKAKLEAEEGHSPPEKSKPRK